MMYFPYFRGKQNELICLRESAELVSGSAFIPIIEPVKSSTSGLLRCIRELSEEDAGFLLIANPACGDFKLGLPVDLVESASELIQVNKKASWAYLLSANSSVQGLSHWLKKQEKAAVVHGGGHSGSAVSSATAASAADVWCNIFIESTCGKLYRKHFSGATRVLIRDGFERRNNKSHPDIEPFSDLHLTYLDEGMDGFGDFSIVGDEYLETGGPAYAVALHITFVDEDQDSSIFIHHFKSDTNDSPVDPAGKFHEAVTKLRAEAEKKKSKILRTSAVEEFIKLQKAGHYPGLGYAKKLGMQHHLELMDEVL